MSSPAPAAGTPATRDNAFWTWLVPVLSFLAGLVLAGAAFFLLFDDDAAGEDDVAGPAVSSSPQQPDDPGEADELVVQVPSQCVEAAEAVGTVTGTFEDAATAVRDLDAGALQQTLDVLEDLRPELERTSQECLDIAADARVVTPSPDPTPSAAPARSPSAAPTT